MIRKFDNKCAADIYRREFAHAVSEGDFDVACDRLIKFTEEYGNAEFHKAFGMLYLLMARDSDDREYLTLAFREFMMHLVNNAPSYDLCRNITAVILMRHDPIAAIDWSVWIKAHGFDFGAILSELGEVGLDIFDSEYPDLEDLFRAGEFGHIDPDYEKYTDGGVKPSVPQESSHAKKRDKIIDFRGYNDRAASDSVSVKKKGVLKMSAMPLSFDEIANDDFSLDLLTAVLDEDPQFFEGDDYADDTLSPAEKALRAAERHVSRGEFEEAEKELDKISVCDGRLYYCGECVRAYMLLECDDVSAAHAALKRALSVNPAGALAGTLLCTVYELKGKPSRIPAVLAAIDNADFIDADHVYKAARFAVDYCKPQAAVKLLRDYAQEYNVTSVRLLYAQMLYIAGDEAGARTEIYKLTRVLYDDLTVHFYYALIGSGLPISEASEEISDELLGAIINGFMSSVKVGDYQKNDNVFALTLEAFLTLEFDNSRKVTCAMFECLKKLTADADLEKEMACALVSPFVEPLVKAVILSERMLRGKFEFIAELDYRPVTSDMLSVSPTGLDGGALIGYAFVAALCPQRLREYTATAEKYAEALRAAGFSDEETAYCLLKRFRGRKPLYDRSVDSRLHFALGFETKTQAENAYKRMPAVEED